MLSRRHLIASGLAGLLARAADSPQAPVRQITHGPKYHWFGYYDKLQFDPTGRYVLGMEVDFEHRSPMPDDVIRLGYVDLKDNDRWVEIGSSRAWNWQQGSMLQFLPGSASEVIWNDRQDNRFVSVIHDIQTGRQRVVPSPIYCLNPDGKHAVTPDFRRLNDCRPGYGYAGIPDPNAAKLAPSDAGIWRVNLETGKRTLIISFADAASIGQKGSFPKRAKHWFNHLLFSPDGKRFIFLHRWRGEGQGQGFSTRMFTANDHATDLYLLDPYGKTSHFIWRDGKHVLAWAWHPSLNQERFYLYTDRTAKVEPVGPEVMTVNGHCTYLPGGRFILNDTYPDRNRNQNVFLYDIASGREVPLGSFQSPVEYKGEWRCDTHPRFSPDGTKVCIDSPHNGGRQMYVIDLTALTKTQS